MKILFDESRQTFLLSSKEMTYSMAVVGGKLFNLYWGPALDSAADTDSIRAERGRFGPRKYGYAYCEYRSCEPFDFGEPALKVCFADGAQTLRLRYVSHEIDGDKLTILLRDEYYPLECTLVYQTWGDLPLIGRSAVIRNTGDEPIRLDTAKSATFQLPSGRDWRVTHYCGAWAAEYHKNQTMLTQARLVLQHSNLTGVSSEVTPFFALDEGGKATETTGEVYFGVMQWSGDFELTIENQYGKGVSVTGGVSHETARIPLAGGESFETPVFVGGFSPCGFGRMSEIFYDWQFDHILPRGAKKDKAHSPFPIIYNSWYPYEFSVNEENILGLIPKAAYIGAELFVIDDGWMKKRVDDKAGLGDWVLDEERFPHGMGVISDACHDNGLLFGLWVEPEMVNPDSDLYRAHPDWILSEPNRERTLMRTQCILDMSRDEITDWTIAWLDDLIVTAKLDYVKWDMNRVVSEAGLHALDSGLAIKYMKNVRRIWQHLNEKFPDLLLENCASGAGRADFGMVPFADRINRSDNADPVDVLQLHEGFSTFLVPKSAGGAGNVSPSPYNVNGRYIPLDYRIDLGMTGSMSIGIDLLKAPDDEIEKLREATARYKVIRPALHDSYVYRIASAFENNYVVLEYCKRDRSQFTVFAFGHGLHHWDKNLPRFRMRGLDPDAVYVSGDLRMTGKALMNIGLNIPLKGDYSHRVITFVREE